MSPAQQLEIAQARIRSLESEIKILKDMIAVRDSDQVRFQRKLERLDRMEKGMNLVQRWAEERSDEFLQDLVDLMDG